MRILSLEVRNFRAIDLVEVNSDSTMVVIAGPNGCGKSCVLDAIRLAKSTYGGYEVDEFNSWFGEFQINPNSPVECKRVLRDKSKRALIKLEVSLHHNEIRYLRENSGEIAEKEAVRLHLPRVSFEEWCLRLKSSGQLAQKVIQEIDATARNVANDLSQRLELERHEGNVIIQPTGRLQLTPNSVLQAIWSIYEPQSVGIVDYHGPQRYFARESVGNVHLNLRTQEQSQRQSALYNYTQKYANIKTQMATEYVIQALRKEGGDDSLAGRALLSETLRELFKKFFPGKDFQGVTANSEGELEFAVNVHGIDKHDINDLSSGEKEILFGYLRLRNNAQRQSIILLDEPELHLNPKLIQGLPQFYEKYVGADLDNQIWTVTHSDAFLREAISSSGTKVLHMRESAMDTLGQNQLLEITGRKEEENATLELIGDIAGYRPGGKVVVFEGEDSEFDKRMTAKLFPNFDRKMNFVSGGNRATVRRLHEVLESQSEKGRRLTFSIVDKDDASSEDADEDRGMYTWDVYHIENYLLEPKYILEVLERASLYSSAFESEREIEDIFRSIAEEYIEKMVEARIRSYSHAAIRKAIQLKDGTANIDPAVKVAGRVKQSSHKIKILVDTDLSEEALGNLALERQEQLKAALHSDEWRKVFRGRDILSSFVKTYGKNLNYQAMRDMIVNAMAEDGHRPSGMLKILAAIDKS
ncbi:MAG: AAA family ATPase [Candidatus Dadabacteria bacterium]|nr:AAA family ATPase [Candidatus Dadabacteria bacterium]